MPSLELQGKDAAGLFSTHPEPAGRAVFIQRSERQVLHVTVKNNTVRK